MSEVDEWDKFGAYLLPSKTAATDLEKISKSHGKNVTECQQALFKLYIKKGRVSWKKVVEALRSAEYINLAEKIERKYC